MSNSIPLKRGFAAILFTALAFIVLPVAAQASPVNLATALPFVALGGQTVTNDGTSVLNGDLGVSPGTALTGFNEAVVNGATHENDAVAAQAQSDLTNAYNVAAGQPVDPADNLSGTNLGNRTLTAGAYRYDAEALLAGPLTLDAAGDPTAQFVFEIGSALTTASASSVLLINGASPCNVYWQVGSSATLGTTTTFVGNLMALTSISLNNGATVLGRLLARNGQISLINDVLTRPLCAAGSTPPETPVSTPNSERTIPPSTTPGSPGTPVATGPGGVGAGPGTGSSPTTAGSSPTAPVSTKTVGKPTHKPTHKRTHKPTREGTAVGHPTPRAACTDGFRATVSGRKIKRVAFSLDGKPIGIRTGSPYAMSVRAAPGAHTVGARVTFTDATHARTMTFPYRACAAATAVLHPHHGPPQFTG